MHSENHKSSIQENIFSHNITQFISKVYQKWHQVKLESVQTSLKITHLTTRKSYLVIVSPVRMYSRGIIWFSRRYATAASTAASADISSF